MGRVAIVGRVKDAIMALEGLEIESILRMTLNPALPQISDCEGRYDSLDSVTPLPRPHDQADQGRSRVTYRGHISSLFGDQRRAFHPQSSAMASANSINKRAYDKGNCSVHAKDSSKPRPNVVEPVGLMARTKYSNTCGFYLIDY